ncbi:MAG: gliding motility-associated C-terminal domain-containing protein [Bacteroidales bacterium]|nr:gliding motility-associated C-terminal domain-containing protein [Candidatus Scybalousia scybalohippi]
MMKIDELFKDKLSNAQSEVKPDLWQKVQSKMATPTPPASQSLWQSLSVASKIVIGSVGALVLGVVALVVYNAFAPEESPIVQSVSPTTQQEESIEDDIVIEDSSIFNLIKTETNEIKQRVKDENTTLAAKETSIFKPEGEIVRAESVNVIEHKETAKTEPIKETQKQNTNTNTQTPVKKADVNTNNTTKTANPEHTIAQNKTPEQEKINIKIPNFISPNGDGINDCFEIKRIEEYPDNMLIIKDRNGKVVYTKRSYDNSFCGVDCKNGAYIYILQVKVNNQTRSFMGSLTIMDS